MYLTNANTQRELLLSATLPSNIEPIVQKVLTSERLTVSDAVTLFEQADLGLLSLLASYANHRKNGDEVAFNKNFHIEPTNICVYKCKFCSYQRELGQEGAWEMSLKQIEELSATFKERGITEVHIVGGVHPKWDVDYYGKMVQRVKQMLPEVHVKAFSAIELHFIFAKAKLSYREGMRKLKSYGLNSIPGGGAEIFDADIRAKICPDKAKAEQWLGVHEAAHLEGVSSNATMLYGHVESFMHRVLHMEQLRILQDKTGGFNCFIPLKFRKANNPLSYLGETNTVDDLKTFAVARLFLDNFKHIKAYWPMLGKEVTKMALSFGVNDIDGTIDDTTKIYSMAGVEDQKPKMTVTDLTALITSAGKLPVERDSCYNVIKRYY
ncbi:MAG TPA: aminofutalosine synthase MqnE [Tenuifilaceae bacterium]|nr:aminofutalosine synthase MqnE [Tenuifilaceae bacterium]